MNIQFGSTSINRSGNSSYVATNFYEVAPIDRLKTTTTMDFVRGQRSYWSMGLLK